MLAKTRIAAPLAPPANDRRWSAVVFARNEGTAIGRCLHALAEAGRQGDLHVTVLLNGTTDRSAHEALTALLKSGQSGCIYAIAEGDKANAFNQFVHALRPPAATYFFLDAYAAVAPDSLHRLDAALLATHGALAAAAVPSTGRSASWLRQNMQQQPGLHGSLFALRGSFVERLTQHGLRIPLGFYRGDGLIGSFVLHDLDAAKGGWRPERLAVEPRATWQAPSLQPWRWQDLRRHWRRLIQQGRGRLQWSAIREVIYPFGFEALPEDADTHVLQWIEASAARRAPRIWRDPFAALALAQMRGAAPRQDLTPRLIAECHPQCG